jgi:hypothetical protein
MTINWTPGLGSTGSVVVVRATYPIIAQPIQGVVYTGDPSFGAGTDLGGGSYVVYVGTGNSVTVNNLTPGTKYYVAVYSYGGATNSPTYNTTVSGATGNITVGTPQSITVAPPRVPLGGVGRPTVIVNYSGGFSAVAAGGSTFSSSNTNVIGIYPGSTVLSGMTNGSATITAVYTEGAITLSNTTVVSVTAPVYTDAFNVNHDYKTGGVTNTIWDGVYAQPGSIPGTTFVSDSAAAISAADANVSSNNTLTVTTFNVGWEFDQNDGFFLFKRISGDFQAAVHITTSLIDSATNALAIYNTPGLLARAYTGNGSPFAGGSESWVSWTRFDEFGSGTYARRTQGNATTQNGQPDLADGEYWLLMLRENGTNFSFYQRNLPTDPWRPSPNGVTYSIPAFAGQPMQVGIQACAFDSDTTATAQFDSFLLDVPRPALQITRSGGNIVVSWSETPAVLQVSTFLLPSSWQTVTAARTTNNGVISVTLPSTNSSSFFRLTQ